jgi:hypothetical protein
MHIRQYGRLNAHPVRNWAAEVSILLTASQYRRP